MFCVWINPYDVSKCDEIVYMYTIFTILESFALVIAVGLIVLVVK